MEAYESESICPAYRTSHRLAVAMQKCGPRIARSSHFSREVLKSGFVGQSTNFGMLAMNKRELMLENQTRYVYGQILAKELSVFSSGSSFISAIHLIIYQLVVLLDTFSFMFWFFFILSPCLELITFFQTTCFMVLL